MEKGEKPWPNPLIQQMIVAEYANIFLTLGMELENRSIVIAGFAGSRWRHHRINTPQTRTSEPVHKQPIRFFLSLTILKNP